MQQQLTLDVLQHPLHAMGFGSTALELILWGNACWAICCTAHLKHCQQRRTATPPASCWLATNAETRLRLIGPLPEGQRASLNERSLSVDSAQGGFSHLHGALVGVLDAVTHCRAGPQQEPGVRKRGGCHGARAAWLPADAIQPRGT